MVAVAAFFEENTESVCDEDEDVEDDKDVVVDDDGVRRDRECLTSGLDSEFVWLCVRCDAHGYEVDDDTSVNCARSTRSTTRLPSAS